MHKYTINLLKVLLNEHYYSVLVSDEKTTSPEVNQAYRKALLTTEKFLDKIIAENQLEVDEGPFPKIERANAALVYLTPLISKDIIKNRGQISILVAKRNYDLFSKLIYEHMFNLQSLTTLEACQHQGLDSNSEVVQAALMWRLRGLDEQVANVGIALVVAKSLIERIDDPLINEMVKKAQAAQDKKLKQN